MSINPQDISRRSFLGAAGMTAALACALRLRAAVPAVDEPGEMLPRSGEALPAKAPADMIRALLVGGGSSHDFETYFHAADSAIFKAAGGIMPAYTSNADEATTQLANADVLVFSANHLSFGSPAFQNAINKFADAGHGIVLLHAAVWYNWADAPAYNRRFVGGGARSHGKGEFTVFNRKPAHPVMHGVPSEFKIVDEQYRVVFDPAAKEEMLAETSPEAVSGKAFPSVWIVKDPKARIAAIALGHANEAHDNPAYKTLLVNAVQWVAR